MKPHAELTDAAMQYVRLKIRINKLKTQRKTFRCTDDDGLGTCWSCGTPESQYCENCGKSTLLHEEIKVWTKQLTSLYGKLKRGLANEAK